MACAFTEIEVESVRAAWASGADQALFEARLAALYDSRGVLDYVVARADAEANKYICKLIDSFHRQADGGS